jgi:hypothetical protein
MEARGLAPGPRFITIYSKENALTYWKGYAIIEPWPSIADSLVCRKASSRSKQGLVVPW